VVGSRFAVIADIHGNAAALEAVLADIDRLGITEIINLGDHFSGPLEAGRTAELLMARAMTCVLGNHDRYLLEQSPEAMGDWEADAMLTLEPHHLDWLRDQPMSRVWNDDVFLCHATPERDTYYWLETVTNGIVHLKEQDEIEAIAEGIPQSLILCGHSHMPRLVEISGGRLIVNPGSVGCPGYDDGRSNYHKVEAGAPHAAYAVIERVDGDWLPSFRKIRYDHASMARLAADRGRPDWARVLSSGRV
jgi:predicted phosphodiesterase